MLRPLGRLALAACALLLPCCGSPDVETPLGVPTAGSSAVSGSGGAGTAGQVAGGSASGGVGTGTGGGGSGQATAGSSAGGAVACTSFADAAGYTLPVHIKNSSTT